MSDSSRWKSEQGVILVFTAIAIVALIGMLTFVVDYGLLWVSRGEAQNAADSGALAGAIAHAYDDSSTTPPIGSGVVWDSAFKMAKNNVVWNATGTQQAVNVSWGCPTGVPGWCVRVDVYRNNQLGSLGLPLFFGPVIGISTHGVRAMAIARVAVGNATNCMRPFSVVDRWHEYKGVTNEFDGWDGSGNRPPPPPAAWPFDWYEPPTQTSPGSGFFIDPDDPDGDDVGREVRLKTGSPVAQEAWSLPVNLPDGAGGYSSGADGTRDAIAHCIGQPVSIGQYLPVENGEMTGPIKQGLEGGGPMPAGESLFEQDPDAYWDTSTNTVAGSCAPECAPFSPRIVPIAVFDVDEFMWREATHWNQDVSWVPGATDSPGHPGTDSFECPGNGGKCVRVSNIIGFFVESVSGNGVNQEVIGRVVMYPGEFVTGTPTVGEGSAFLKVIQLIR